MDKGQGASSEGYHLVTVELDPEKSGEHEPLTSRTLLVGPTVLSQKMVWEGAWANVPQLPDPWIDFESLHALSRDSEELSERLLEVFSNCLSRLTSTSWEKRSWRILLGPWMKSYAFVFQEKVHRLKLHTQSFTIKTVSEAPSQDFPVNTMDDWVSRTLGFELHAYLFQEVAQSLGISTKIEPACSQLGSTPKALEITRHTPSLQILKALGVLNSGASFLFHKTYLPKWTEFKLALKLGQLPIPVTPAPSSLSYSHGSMREELEEEIAKETARLSPELQHSSLVAAKMLPRAYLENLSEIMELSGKQGWPVAPKVIFDSNGYWADEVFKVYTAQKVADGAKLVIGQHGGMMGASLLHSQQAHQIEISDRFFSWGWEIHGEKRVSPAGVLKRQPKSKPSSRGPAVMPLLSLPKYPYDNCSFPIGQYGWLRYFEDQTSFLKSLNTLGQTDIVLRNYAKDRGNFLRERLEGLGWKTISEGNRPLSLDLPNYRMAIVTYNSTTLIETLGINFPTIAFWDFQSWRVTPEVEPIFSRLESAGILFGSPEAAAAKVEQVWDDVNEWWFDEKVQDARNLFVNTFAQERNEKFLHHTLRKMTLSARFDECLD